MRRFAIRRTPRGSASRTPVLGVVGFLVLAVVSLVIEAGFARVVQLALGAVAGLVGLFLIVVQVRIGRYCPYCLVADASGVASALAASGRLWVARGEPAPWLAGAASAGRSWWRRWACRSRSV